MSTLFDASKRKSNSSEKLRICDQLLQIDPKVKKLPLFVKLCPPHLSSRDVFFLKKFFAVELKLWAPSIFILRVEHKALKFAVQCSRPRTMWGAGWALQWGVKWRKTCTGRSSNQPLLRKTIQKSLAEEKSTFFWTFTINSLKDHHKCQWLLSTVNEYCLKLGFRAQSGPDIAPANWWL